MLAYDLAIQNFAVAEHLLQLHQLFRGMRSYEPRNALTLAVCEEMAAAAGTALHHTKNDHLTCSIKATIPLPSCLLANNGLDFLLRQSVLVACTALESYFWDVLRENALTVIRAKGRKADSSLKDITLTLDDYLSLEGYGDPDERLSQIILKRFERGTLYDLAKIDEIAGILTAKDIWGQMSVQIGMTSAELKGRLMSLVQRRNEITHRADRPGPNTPAEDVDSHGLRAMNHAWATTHVMAAKAVVTASAEIFRKAIDQLRQILALKEEQRLAQGTLRKDGEPPR